MQISAFMSNSKCPELARRFSDQVPKTVTEMMKRVDDFVKSEEAFKSTELPRGEFSEKGHRIMEIGHISYVSPRVSNRRYDNQRQEVNHLSLDALSKWSKEILAAELQLQLPPCPLMVGTPKKENLDRYCDYYDEKGNYTNDCYQLKRQLEATLESERSLSKNDDEVYGSKGIISIQHYLGTYQNERAQGCVIHHSRYDEVPYPKRNCYSGHPNSFCVRKPVIGKKYKSSGKKRLKRQSRTDSKNLQKKKYSSTQLSQSKRSQPGHNFPKNADFNCGIEKESFGHREEPSSDEGGGRIGQGWNLEAYRDDMVIKSKTEREMIMDIAKTFDNLCRVNIKLNPRKCSFGVEEGKFLGYMLTSEGIRANPRRQKQ
ncbi:hypothetical protein Tco_0295489 [Tanacetum coccineum]